MRGNRRRRQNNHTTSVPIMSPVKARCPPEYIRMRRVVVIGVAAVAVGVSSPARAGGGYRREKVALSCWLSAFQTLCSGKCRVG